MISELESDDAARIVNLPARTAAPMHQALQLVGDLVLDPFMGSGTTLVAARVLGAALAWLPESVWSAKGGSSK